MYYIAKNGQQSGPFPETEVQQKIQAGDVAPTDMCWKEGMADWQPVSAVFTVTIAPPPLPGTASSNAATAPLFLYIPTSRLIVLSIVSMSLYEVYWIYKNWRYIKERDGLNIRPFWRGWFGIFYCHSLLRRIHEDGPARSYAKPTFSPGSLATGWVVLLIVANIVGRAPSVMASIIAAFIPSFLCLVSVQNYINAVTEKRNPSQRHYGWSSGHIVCLVFGIIVWATLLLGLAAEL